jgi:hypothetical protein
MEVASHCYSVRLRKNTNKLTLITVHIGATNIPSTNAPNPAVELGSPGYRQSSHMRTKHS